MEANISERFPAEVEAVLRESGWYPGRRVDEERLRHWYVVRWETPPAYCRMFPAALRVLREFGDIQVNQDSPGITCYRNSFVFDPLRTISTEDGGWIYYEWILEQSLFPLGIFPKEEITIAIDMSGRVIEIGESFGVLANSFDEALIRMVRGIGLDDQETLDIGNFWEKNQEARKVQQVLESPTPLTLSPQSP